MARTFFGNGFIKTAPWIADPSNLNQRLLRFTFQTSERNGLLLLLEGNGHTFTVMLQDGCLVIGVDLGMDNSDQHIFDQEIVNDNRPHTLTIHQVPSSFRFEYRLDSGDVVQDTYASNIYTNFGTNETYFGGSPSGIANGTNFVGCLRDFLSAVGNNLSVMSDNSELQALDVLSSEGRVEGDCRDPCADRDCGNGTCVPRWPDRAFCDCRGSNMVGENCTEGKRWQDRGEREDRYEGWRGRREGGREGEKNRERESVFFWKSKCVSSKGG